MYLEMGSFQDAREIARVYQNAFPASVQLFFGKKSPATLLDLLELTFAFVMHWGGQAMLIRDRQGQVGGYCLYLSGDDSPRRDYRTVILLLSRMAGKISLPELGRLLRNKLLMAVSVRHTKKVPKPKARILSMAMDPAYQGQGAGTLLFHSALKKLQHHSVGLNVRADNPAGRRLYAGAGFEECGSTRDLSGEWLILVKPSS